QANLVTGYFSPADAGPSRRKAVALWESLAAEFPDNRDHATDLARSCERLGGEPAFRQRLAIWQRLAADVPDNRPYRGELGRSHGDLGWLLRGAGRLPEAEAHYRASVKVLEH